MDIARRWLVLDRDVGDLEGRIYRSIRDRVLGGALPAGRRLPSGRGVSLREHARSAITICRAHVENVNADIQRLALSHVVVQTRAAAPRLRER